LLGAILAAVSVLSHSPGLDRARGAPAADSLQARPGFRVELVAAEPEVESPVALAFDEQGRLFVAEAPGYADRRPEGASKGRIRLLRDPGSNGVYRASLIYADDLARPSALACYQGGVFVAAGSEILYLKDRQTNGVADLHELAFSGFGGATPAASAKAELNSFQWGLDNRIHGVTGGLGGVVVPSGGVGNGPVSLQGSDFCFDPRTRSMFPEAAAAQSGLAFDESGRRLACDLDRPLMLAMYARRYFARNPFFPKPVELVDVVEPGVAVFPFHPTETPRGAGAVGKAGRSRSAAAWMTAARSCLIYRGNAFPREFAGNVFIADPEAQVIHREILREDGLEVRAERAPSEAKSEFLTSSDPAFHPMQIAEGPDGALYIADRREGESGRIYRVVPANFRPTRLPQLGRATTYALVAALAHPNGWQRETAARLLYERQDRAAVPLLSEMLSRSRVPQARRRALHALAGLGALTEEHLRQALGDEDQWVRQDAVLLTESLVVDGAISDALWEQLRTMGADPSPHVRYQFAFTAGEIQRPEKAALLADLLRREGANPWLRAAVYSSLAANAPEVFFNLARDPQVRGNPAGFETLEELADMIGVMRPSASAVQTLDFLVGGTLEMERLFKLTYALGQGLHRGGSSLAQIDAQQKLLPFANQAALQLIAGTLDDVHETLNLHLLSMGPFIPWNGIDWPFTLLRTGQSQQLQAEAIDAMRLSPDPAMAANLLARYPGLSPALRTAAAATLLAGSSRVSFTLAALEQGKIRANEVPPEDLNLLRNYPDPAIQERARQLFGPWESRRPNAMAQYQSALGLTGSADRGRELFSARCSVCHPLESAETLPGPNLAGIKIKGRQYALGAILEPNAEVRPGRAASLLRTKQGEDLLGVVTDENLAAVTLARPGRPRAVWPRDNLRFIQTLPFSLMPEGLEAGLSAQDLADLLEFLMAPAPR
jgi:putative membrane-bound dehydrogenase-like protein